MLLWIKETHNKYSLAQAWKMMGGGGTVCKPMFWMDPCAFAGCASFLGPLAPCEPGDLGFRVVVVLNPEP